MTTSSITTPPCGDFGAHPRHKYMVEADGSLVDIDDRRTDFEGCQLMPCPGYATEMLRELYNCPDWCVRDDHVDPIHYGPDFGDRRVGAAPQGMPGEPLELMVWIGGDGHDKTLTAPTDARQLAAILIKAAEWMEAQR